MSALSAPEYVWQLLDGRHGTDYDGDAGRGGEALGLLAFAPTFALDVGCASGGRAQLLKARYPQCLSWGIEPDAEAAKRARGCMDRVFDCTLEAMDWTEPGPAIGKIDTVFLLDVLEHMYNPWSALVTLREVISPDAQLVISLPNVRNMLVMRDLMNGYWHYRESGLFDVTHIRFFTEHEGLRMIYQTGFRVEKTTFTVCPGVLPIYEQMQNRAFPQTIAFEKGSCTG